MKLNHQIKIPKGYNSRTQAKVGLFAAQLDDQLRRLKDSIKGLTVKQLEWQPRAGMNTIGMLLAHNALVEVWWIVIAPNDKKWDDETKKKIRKICGVHDDGMPLAKNGKHPSYLKKMSADKYIKVISRSRRAIHTEMKKWYDKDLDKIFKLGKYSFSRTWVLYHVLEHFAGHFGQVLLLKHMMQDRGILKEKKKVSL